jgi:hypothetical protein
MVSYLMDTYAVMNIKQISKFKIKFVLYEYRHEQIFTDTNFMMDMK